jgi:hypothetical protein
VPRSPLQKQAAEDSLRAFVEQAWDVLEPGTKFIPGVHVDAVCLHLQAMIEGRIKDLLINIPPGFAKSLIGAVFMPAWVWIKDPGYRFLFSSYKADYAIRDSVKCRTLIQSNWYQDRWKDRFQLKTDQNEKSKFENDHTGYREITSVGSCPTSSIRSCSPGTWRSKTCLRVTTWRAGSGA